MDLILNFFLMSMKSVHMICISAYIIHVRHRPPIPLLYHHLVRNLKSVFIVLRFFIVHILFGFRYAGQHFYGFSIPGPGIYFGFQIRGIGTSHRLEPLVHFASGYFDLSRTWIFVIWLEICGTIWTWVSKRILFTSCDAQRSTYSTLASGLRCFLQQFCRWCFFF